MSFKAGDRVKAIADTDELGVLGLTGEVLGQISDNIYTIDFKDTHVMYAHELQLIPMSLASDEPSHEEHLKAHIEAEERGWQMNCKEKGERSETGSLRYNTGKPKMSLVTPEFILGMAKVLTKGAEKYGERNWELGNKTSVPYDSAMRHILAWRSGEDIDQESQCDHLFHGAVNLLMAWYYAKHFPEMDDRYVEKES